MTAYIASGFVNITPTTPLPLAGYVDRTTTCAGVADELEANAIVLREAGRTMVLVAFDLLYVGAELRRQIASALPEVRAEDLFLAASHTHFAPATDATLPALGKIAPAYVDMVAERVINLVQTLCQGEFRPLAPAIGQVQATHAVNRRRSGWRISRRFPFLRHNVIMKPNPLGPKDETIRVIRLSDDAFIWHYACHPVLVPWMNHVSADFVGVVRQAIRHARGERAAVLFFQGFAADVYPSFASTLVSISKRIGRYLGIAGGTVSADVWHAWSKSLAGRVVAADKGAIDFVPDMAPAERRIFPVREVLPGDVSGKNVAVHRLCFGPLNVLGISAEVAIDYAAFVASALPRKEVMCVGCIDGVFGYIPTAAMIAEGGYESLDFLPYFGMTGPFAPEIEQVFKGKLTDPGFWTDRTPEDRRAA